MPELFVMRHAKSDWNNTLPDFERPLAERGHRNAQQMAEWLEDQGLVPDRIVTSSANRARTTAEYVADVFDLEGEAVEHRGDLYMASALDWFDVLSEQSVERLLICGHNPGLDDLVEVLADGPVPLTRDGKLMTTAAIAVFTVAEWSLVSERGVALETIVRPRELG